MDATQKFGRGGCFETRRLGPIHPGRQLLKIRVILQPNQMDVMAEKMFVDFLVLEVDRDGVLPRRRVSFYLDPALARERNH